MTRLQSFFYKIFYFFFYIPMEGMKPVFSQILDWSAAMYAEFVLIVMRRVESDFAPKLKPMIEKMEATGKVPPEMKPLTDEMKDPKAPIAAMLGTSMAGTATGSLMGAFLGPYLLLLQYENQRLANQARWDPATGLAVVYRRPDKEALVNSDLRDQGWTAERIELLKDVARTRLVEDLCVELRRREVYTKEVYLESMHWLGYEEKEAEDYYTSKEAWPGISDLVRMAVREAFTPEIAEKFGQYQDLPPEFLARAKKIGLPEDYAKAFWAAHWDLPSVQMGYDMLHRGIITMDELRILLRALDIMPFWRDKLINLSYAPFTRVDVRRMHKLGILTRDQVKQSYRDIGYNDEKAEALTQFTLALNAEKPPETEKEFVRADILAAYRARLWSAELASAAIVELGYLKADADLIVASTKQTALVVAKIPKVVTKDLVLSQIKALYTLGLRTKVECNAFMLKFGYDAAELAALYDLWDWEKPAAVKLPSRSDLDQFYTNAVITEATWRLEMAKQQYDSLYIDWYFNELLAEIAARVKPPAVEKAAELTLAQLQALYTDGLRTKLQITPLLAAKGYTPEGITALFEIWDWEKPAVAKPPAVKALTMTQLQDLYALGLKTKADISPILSGMGYSAADINSIYALWDYQKPVVVTGARLPTRADLDKWLGLGVIGMQEWSDGYTALGYTITSQELYYAALLAKEAG